MVNDASAVAVVLICSLSCFLENAKEHSIHNRLICVLPSLYRSSIVGKLMWWTLCGPTQCAFKHQSATTCFSILLLCSSMKMTLNFSLFVPLARGLFSARRFCVCSQCENFIITWACLGAAVIEPRYGIYISCEYCVWAIGELIRNNVLTTEHSSESFPFLRKTHGMKT